jgi:nicotinate-nucleotide pyrophosphorylase (carboxylating)
MTNTKRYSSSTFLNRLTWADLDLDYLRQLVGLAKIEDLAGAGLAHRPKRLGDVTSALMPEGNIGQAQLTAREPLVICGLGLVQIVLNGYSTGCHFDASVQDGDALQAGERIGTLSGPSVALLQAERVLLNFLQHLSGIATETRAYVAALQGSPTALLDTRKTLPGYRILQKYAFACGGGHNHRIGLYDRVMLKDNHLAVAGATGGNRLTETVALAVSTFEELAIEVEVDHLEQIPPVLAAGADIVLLDNFTIADLKTAIALIGDRASTEASGGIQIDRLAELGRLGLDFISTGAPIHQSTWKDIGLDWS